MTSARSKTNRPFKILLIGDSSVGKTCLLFRFADDKFSEKLTPTIGIDFVTKAIHVRDKTVKLQLWDTAGQEKFSEITRPYYRGADAIILVYDRTEARSFQRIAHWMEKIDQNASEDVIRILVGNKSDLHQRLVISTEDGKKLAERFHVDFFETSAKSDTNRNVPDMFYCLIEKLLDLKQPSAENPTKTIDLSKTQSNFTYEKLTNCC